MAANAKKRPRTGEPRQIRQRFSVDLLPMDLLETIKRLRADLGLSWPEIERLSSLPYDANWEKSLGSHGFVNWDAMPTSVLEGFPNLRIPHSNLHRWYDVQVEQKQKEVLARAAQAREIATAFAKATVAGANEAVLNAARDVIFGLLESTDKKSQVLASKAMLALADVMNGVKANEIKERRVTVDEGRLKLLERKLELVQKKAGKLIQAIEGAEGEKPVKLTREQLLQQVKEIYGAA